MKVGIIGLGKLGLPVAVAMAHTGEHDVMGYDIDESRMTHEPQTYQERGLSTPHFNDDLCTSPVHFGSLEEVVSHAEIVFVAVQTPHDPMYEGITKLQAKRVDFNYKHLYYAIKNISDSVNKETIVVIISTVLPGTIRREILPAIRDDGLVKLVYNPFFIAMGTVIPDFLHPEFILLGGNDPIARDKVEEFYGTLMKARSCKMSIESAELTKVAYNTFISSKLSFVNTLLEIAHKSPGVNIDEVTNALCQATDRLISPKYMIAGMGDGGGCHPRDNIALSWLSRELNLKYDFFEAIMMSREKQAEWLADLMKEHDMPKCILGYSFKVETNITTGSHALLVKEFLDDVKLIDPHVDGGSQLPYNPHVFLIGMNHPEFAKWKYPNGSVIIDPWRYIPDMDNCFVIRLGE